MRIASFSPAITEILFALGQGRQVVLRDAGSDSPEEVYSIPVGDMHVIDPEEIDLVFVEDMKTAEEIRKKDVQCVHLEIGSLEQLYQAIVHVGTILDCEDDARRMTEGMRHGFNSVKKKARLLPEKLSVCLSFDVPTDVPGWVLDIIKLSGGELSANEDSQLVIRCTDGREVGRHILDRALLTRPGPRLIEGAQRVYGWLFEELH